MLLRELTKTENRRSFIADWAVRRAWLLIREGDLYVAASLRGRRGIVRISTMAAGQRLSWQD